MNNRCQAKEEEEGKSQIGTGRFDYDKYIYEQRKIEEELDSIEDDKMCRSDLLMNIKMYDDSMKEMEIMKDRLGLWKESLEYLNESIGRDGLYVKEIAIKVVERKVDELMNERKMILKKMMNKLENFTNVMKTSMDCMSNSIIDFEKKVYSSGENNDYFSFDFKSNNRICKSYFQLCQRLKEYLKNMSPYFKDNLEVEIGLDTEMNMNTGLGLEDQQFETRTNIFKSIECENGELKSIIMEESKLLREPVILMIDPKRMQVINLRNKNSISDLDEILSSSITLNPSSFTSQLPMTNVNNSMNNRLFEQKCDLGPRNSNNAGTNDTKFEQKENQEQTRERGECGHNDEGNDNMDTDVSISIKKVKHRLGNNGMRGRPRSKSKFSSRSNSSSSSSSRPRSRPKSSSSSSSRSRSRSKFKSESRIKSRSVSEPRITFKKDSESKMNKIRDLVSELESELGSQSETESSIYIRKSKSKHKERAGNRRSMMGRNSNIAVTNTRDGTIIEKKNNFKKEPKNQNSRLDEKVSSSCSRYKFKPRSRPRYKSKCRSKSKSCSSPSPSSSLSSSFYLDNDSSSDSSSRSRTNFHRNSKIELKELIRDYSNLYAEYIVSKNLSKIKAYY